jgi:circadian clock protein KaiC
MNKVTGVEKLATRITGFDHISAGGLPQGRTTLVCGSAGSGKTVFGAQFLAEGILKTNERGVLVTFEESPEAIRKNMLGFGWNIADWEEQKKWSFVDASPKPFENVIEAGDYDLQGLLVRIEGAVKKVSAKRVCLDSVGAIFSQFENTGVIRRELFNIASTLNGLGVTTIMTAERTAEYGDVARYGVEEFVADNVILLRNPLDQEKRRRTMEILKFRGTSHLKGEYPFTILSDCGIVVIPLSALELKQRSSDRRTGSGSRDLDEMCGGGFFQDSIVLVSGATGTGKTLMATEFMRGAAAEGERAMFFAYEESHDQLHRNAVGWGVDFYNLARQNKLKVLCEYPETRSLDDHLLAIRRNILEFKPTRIVIDSLSALERVSTERSYREFVVGLTAFIKEQEVAAMFTATTPTLLGGTSVTEAHISTITDSIILLRYVEIFGEMRRGITVLKMRGSTHDKNIREFTIDGKGMHIGQPFRGVTSILTGNPVHRNASEIDHLGQLFKERM